MIDLALAAFMFNFLLQIALWAPGLLLGANMVVGGVALIVVAALERRKLASIATPGPADHSDSAGLNGQMDSSKSWNCLTTKGQHRLPPHDSLSKNIR